MLTQTAGKIDTLKYGKKAIDQATKGSECGIGFAKYEAFEVGDMIQTFEEVREVRKL